MLKLYVNVDGWARENPGDAAIGVVLTDEHGNVVDEHGQRIGRSSKAMAKYKAFIEGARRAMAYSPEEAVFLTDDHTLVNQLNGITHPREPHLQRLTHVARSMLEQFPKWRVNYVEQDAIRAAQQLAVKAHREHARQQREHTQLCRQLEGLLRELSTDELRRVVNYVRSLYPAGADQ